MFKTKEEIIVIQAEAITPIPTGVVFWSHDKGTAKMLFQLQKDYVNQTLSEGTIVPICLDFVGGRHIYHAVIEDAVNGIVSIVLEDNILGYVGRVDGSVYIELPDSRSLDTAGRFTFDIKRSPIDENVPELEDYYWQGFNEIMAQYHQTIATIKLEAKTLLDSLTADVTTAQNKVTTLEQSITTANTNLNARIDEINKKIDDNDVFTKAESSANVIYQIIGKEKVKMTFTLDYLNKIAGSDVENPNSFGSQNGESILKPSNSWNIGNQTRYNALKELDGKTSYTARTLNNRFEQNLFSFNVLEIVKRQLGEEFFLDQGAVSNSEQIELLKPKITNDRGNVYGWGSGSDGNKMSFAVWNVRWLNWSGTRSTTASTVTNINLPINNANEYIDSDGICRFIAYSNASDGTTASSLNIDYANYQFTIELSMNEHIKSLMAANHVQNLATQDEAEAGTDNTKAMTPLGTAQQIEKKAVMIAGNQTIGGIKNFRDGLTYNGVTVMTSETATQVFDSATTSEIQAGSIRFDRIGKIVIVTLNFQVRADRDISQDQNIVYGLNSNLACDADFTDTIANYGGTTALVNIMSTKITARTALTKSTWYVGRIVYKTKN